MCTSTNEDVTAIGKLDLPWQRHELEEGAFEDVFQHKEIATDVTLNGTSETLTKMTHDMPTGSKFLTASIERLGQSTNTFNLIKMCCRLQAWSNESTNIKHEGINSLGCLSIRDSLPNDAKVTAKDVTKLGAMIATLVATPLCRMRQRTG